MATAPPIAWLTGGFPRWSETFIEQELRLLLDTELPLLPVALHPGNRELPAYLEDCVHYLSETAPAPATASVPAAGGAAGLLPPALRRQASLLKHRAELQALVALLREYGVGHIHAAFADLPGLLAAAAARELGISYSLSIHAQDAVQAKYDDEYIFRQAAFVTVCNARARDLFVARCPWAAERTHLLHHGLVLADWRLRPEPWAPHDPYQFLLVGRLVEKKDPLRALRYMVELNDNWLSSLLHVIGDGPLRPALERAPGAADYLHLDGVQPRVEVRKALAAADFLLVTSRELPDGDMEGIPNVILEAMASGVPVIATPTGGITEVVTAATGWILGEEEAANFPRFIHGLLQDRGAVQARCAAARRLVEQRFDAQALIAGKADLLRGAGISRS